MYQDFGNVGNGHYASGYACMIAKKAGYSEDEPEKIRVRRTSS